MDYNGTLDLNNGKPSEKQGNPEFKSSKPNVVVITGATGSGKSRLAVDLASHFPIEIINADSMQVYQGLDVLTNKVPLLDQKGVPHHLLGTIDPNVEFTAKNFRDSAVSLISDIISRDHLPVIVGGTNYYIQALASPFLLDDSFEVTNDTNFDDHLDDESRCQLVFGEGNGDCTYDSLRDLDPVAANRVHPNDQRKINQYFSTFARTGVLPSKLLQGKAMEKWGNIDNCRYNCCFICVDASLPVIDLFVEHRVDHMIEAGLLIEVCNMYDPNSDYTRGLRQAIGVREFEEFFRVYRGGNAAGSHVQISTDKCKKKMTENISAILSSSDENELKSLLKDAIDKVKANTRKLVRRQVFLTRHGAQMLLSPL